MEDRKELNNELEKVTGGNEPEEFDWKPKGYQTPIKEEPENLDWHFKPINKDNINNNK